MHQNFSELSLIIFCIENNIERIFSRPYHRQVNRAIKSANRTIEIYVNEYFYKLPKGDFPLEIAILDALDFHNNNQHFSTKSTPLELKDTTDENLIE